MPHEPKLCRQVLWAGPRQRRENAKPSLRDELDIACDRVANRYRLPTHASWLLMWIVWGGRYDATLGITENTYKHHLKKIFKRTKAKSRLEVRCLILEAAVRRLTEKS